MKAFKDYLVSNTKFSLPVAAESLGITEKEVAKLMGQYCRSGALIHDMWHQRPPAKTWVWEQMRGFKRNIHLTQDEYEILFSREVGSKAALDTHISYFGHDLIWKQDALVKGRVAGVTGNEMLMGHLWIEMDRKDDEEPLLAAMRDALNIIEYNGVEDYATIYWSGNNSVHLCLDGSLFGDIVGTPAIMAGRTGLAYNIALELAQDVRHENGCRDPHVLSREELADVYNKTFKKEPLVDATLMIRALENIDPNIYNQNSTIRQPYSTHPKTRERKLPMDYYSAKTCVRRKSATSSSIIRSFKYKTTKDNYVRASQTPILMDVVQEARKRVVEFKERKYSSFNENAAYSSFILKKYSEIFDMTLDESMANEDGWMGDFYNPFYDDQSPSVRINIRTGQMVDYGSDEYRNLSFTEVVALADKISYKRSALRWTAIKESDLYESSFRKRTSLRLRKH